MSSFSIIARNKAFCYFCSDKVMNKKVKNSSDHAIKIKKRRRRNPSILYPKCTQFLIIFWPFFVSPFLYFSPRNASDSMIKEGGESTRVKGRSVKDKAFGINNKGGRGKGER